MKDKVKALSELNGQLSSPNQLAGLFLPPGSNERDDVLFIAEMPSMNEPKDRVLHQNYNFGVTARDKFFQEMLVKYGLAGVYVTDIVKSRNVPGKPTKKEIFDWLPFLMQEIKILDPQLIIVIGKRTFEASFMPYVYPKLKPDIACDYIFHYCSQIPRTKFEKRFSAVLEKYNLHR